MRSKIAKRMLEKTTDKTREKVDKYAADTIKANRMKDALNAAFALGQKYEKDKTAGMSGEYSEFYLPTLDRIHKDLFALFDVSDSLNLKQIELVVQAKHFDDGFYGNSPEECEALIEKTRNKIGYTKTTIR